MTESTHFQRLAIISQEFKARLYGWAEDMEFTLTRPEQEAIDIISHQLARIVTDGADNTEAWRTIATVSKAIASIQEGDPT